MSIPTKNKSYTGMRGAAEVRVLAEDTLRVIFADGDTYTVNKNGWERPSGLYNITLSKTNDEIKFASPPYRAEPYLVRFEEYANRIGVTDDNPGVPEPKVEAGGWRQGRTGPYYEADKLIFTAKLVVAEKGAYKGLNIPHKLPYIFAQYPGTMISMLEGTSGERRKVETFLQLTGYDMVKDEIAWAGNVLPFLEARQQAANKIFTMRLNEKGFVDKDGLSSISSYLLTPEMLGEDVVKTTKKTPAKKKPAKSKVAATKKPTAKKARK